MNKYALIAWVIFMAITFGGLGYALWGLYLGVFCTIAGGFFAYLATVRDPAEEIVLNEQN